MKHNMATRLFKLSAGMALIGMTAGCAGTDTASGDGEGPGGLLEMDPITLKLADVVVENSADGQAVVEMIDYIEEASDGKITVQPYWSGSLLNASQTAEGIQSGVADLGRISVANNPADFPVPGWFTPMGSTATKSYPMSNLVGVPTHIEMYNDPSSPFYESLESDGLHPLALNSATTNEMVCADEISDPADLQGLQVRVPGPPYAGEVESLGMVPVNMAGTEMYEALERGVIDCAVVSTTYMSQIDLLSVARSYLPLSLSINTGGGYAINKELWDGLPEEAQQILMEGAAVFSVSATRGQVEERQTLKSTFEDKGVKIVDITAFLPTIEAHQQKVVEALPSSAPDSLADPARLMEDYEAALAENEKQIAELGVEEMSDFTAESWEQAFDTGADQVDWDAYQHLILDAITRN